MAEFKYEITQAEHMGYTFPRRSFIRYVVKDEKCYGCSGIKPYDDKRSFLYFSYVDGIEDDRSVHAALILQLEKDAEKNGAESIFINIENDEFDWYASLGYQETERIEDEETVRLQGAHIIFDKTVEKQPPAQRQRAGDTRACLSIICFVAQKRLILACFCAILLK